MARTAGFSASFNANLDVSTVNSNSITLVGPEGNIVATRPTTAGNVVQLDATAGALPGDTPYTVTLSSAIKDSTARALTPAVTRTFTTASQNWSPTTIDIASLPYFTGNTSPSISVDAAGNATAAWITNAGSFATILASRMDPATGTWGAPATVYTSGWLDPIRYFKAVPGPAGDVFLSWTSYSAGSSTIKLARYAASSGSWSAAADVAAVPTGVVPPDAAEPITDTAGNLTLLTTTTYAMYATRYDVRANSWGAPVRVELPYSNNYVFNQHMVTDGQGNIVASWVQQDDQGRGIYSARYDAATSTWAGAQRVANGPLTGMFDAISMGVDGAGAVTMAWTRDGGMAVNKTIWAARLDPASLAWSIPVRVDYDEPGALDAYYVTLAVDAAGYATATWGQFGGMHSARLAPGAVNWSTPTIVTPSFGNFPSVMRADVAGNVTVLWVLNQQVMAVRYLAGMGQWQAPVAIGTPASGAGTFVNYPVAGIDATGTVVAAWFAQNQGTPQYVVTSNRLR